MSIHLPVGRGGFAGVRASLGSVRLSSGEKVVVAAFALMYAGPLLGNSLLAGDVRSPFTILPLTPAAVAALVAAFLLFLVFHRRLLPRIPRRSWPRIRHTVDALGAAYLRHRMAFAILALAMAVVFVASGLNTYRYAPTRISEGVSGWVIPVAVVRVAVTLDLLHTMFFGPRVEAPLRSRRGLETLLLSAALVVSADGTGSMLLALLTVAFAVRPRLFWRMAFTDGAQAPARRLVPLAVATALLVLAFLAASFAGEFIKVSAGAAGVSGAGIGEVVLGQFATGADLAPPALVARLSTYYYSFLFTLAHPWSELNAGLGSVLRIPLENAWFRFDFLTGGWFDAERPPVGTLTRWNYLLLSENPSNPREGSSPGVLAAFNYVFPLPLGIVLGALYLGWLARAGDVLVRTRPGERLSLLGAFLLLLFVIAAFQSPFDLLLVFDLSALLLVPLFLLYLSRAGAAEGPDAPHPEATHRVDAASASYATGRAAAVAARPLVLFAANAVLVPQAAQGIAVAFLVSSLALLASAADTHRAYYARRFHGPRGSADDSFAVYAASVGLLALAGSAGVVLAAWHIQGSVWLGLACAAYFASEKLMDEVLRLRLFQAALHAWGRAVLARTGAQLILLGVVFAATGPALTAPVAVLALALGNLVVFVPQVPVRAWLRARPTRSAASELAIRGARALGGYRGYWALGVLGAGVAYLDRLAAVAVDLALLPLFMLVVMCFSAVTMSVDFFYLSRHRREFLQQRIRLEDVVASRRFQACVAGGLVAGAAASAGVLAFSPNGSAMPWSYVGLIAALQTGVALAIVPREIAYWRQAAGRLIRIEAAFWAFLVPVASAAWLMGWTLRSLLALLVVAAAVRLALIVRLARRPPDIAVAGALGGGEGGVGAARATVPPSAPPSLLAGSGGPSSERP